MSQRDQEFLKRLSEAAQATISTAWATGRARLPDVEDRANLARLRVLLEQLRRVS